MQVLNSLPFQREQRKFVSRKVAHENANKSFVMPRLINEINLFCYVLTCQHTQVLMIFTHLS